MKSIILAISQSFTVTILLAALIGTSVSLPATALADTQFTDRDVTMHLLPLQTEVIRLQALATFSEVVASPMLSGVTSASATLSARDQSKAVSLQNKIIQTNAEIAKITVELSALRVKLAAAKAAIVVPTPPVVVPPVVVPPVVVPTTPGTRATYKGLTGSYTIETKNSITLVEATKACVALVQANPTKNIWCSWNAEVISGQKPRAYVLGAVTTAEIVALEESIVALEKSLIKYQTRKTGYVADLAKLYGSVPPPVVVPPPVIVPPVVVPPVVIPPKEVPPTSGNVTPAICGSKPFTRKVPVTNAAELKAALLAANAGDYIALAAGTYSDTFILENKSASAAYPISICGETGTLLKAAGGYVGYGVYLKNVTSVVLANVSISGYLKGVVLDNGDNSVIQNITVSNLGNEGVHFRQGSSNNIIQKSTIFNTGYVEDWFGEGVYIGSANSNWCKYGINCGPDKSDWNQVLNNTIYHTSAESIDIKEGSMGGIIMGNTFEGSAMTGEYADSFIDVKGNNYLIKNNSGKNAFKSNGVSYQLDGYQQHVVYEGYGNNNVFEANSVTGLLPGNVVNLHSRGVGNVVHCNNTATPAATKGMTNARTCI